VRDDAGGVASQWWGDGCACACVEVARCCILRAWVFNWFIVRILFNGTFVYRYFLCLVVFNSFLVDSPFFFFFFFCDLGQLLPVRGNDRCACFFGRGNVTMRFANDELGKRLQKKGFRFLGLCTSDCLWGFGWGFGACTIYMLMRVDLSRCHVYDSTNIQVLHF
jgi:hypothetical protein